MPQEYAILFCMQDILHYVNENLVSYLEFFIIVIILEDFVFIGKRSLDQLIQPNSFLYKIIIFQVHESVLRKKNVLKSILSSK